MQQNDEVVARTVDFVRGTLAGAEGGHDWWHVYRVWKNARSIMCAEHGVDRLVVELGALLHDVADAKFHGGDEEVGHKTADAFLRSLGVPDEVRSHVAKIVRHVSFRHSLEGDEWMLPELQIVRDADRLDALGAIGIARAFSYGGHAGNPLYDPDTPHVVPTTKDAYVRGSASTLDHFYDKLLLLKERMHTRAGKRMVEERHAFMERYLAQFASEWGEEIVGHSQPQRTVW